MASGTEHLLGNRIFTYPVALSSGLVALVKLDWPVEKVLVVIVSTYAGMIIGRYLDPDLDHEKTTISERKMIHRFGIIGYVWWGYWRGYSFFAKHRGMSHTPILGTLTRLLWLGPITIPLAYLFYWNLSLDPIWASLLIGLCTSDIIHWWLDGGRPWPGRFWL